MYNKEKKEAFIKNYETSKSINPYYIRSVFNSSEPFEEAYQKDLSEFSFDEIIDFYKFRNAKSPHTLRTINSILKQYTDFCFVNDKDFVNSFRLLKGSIYEECISKNVKENKYIDYETLCRYQDSLINVSDRFILEALFQGIRGENLGELVSIKEKDIDIEKGIITLYTNTDRTHVSREFKASEKLISLAIESCRKYVYYTNIKDRKLVGDGAVKVGENTRSLQPNYYSIVNLKIRKFREMFGNDELSANRIYHSGFLYYINEIMKEERCTPSEALKSQKGESLKVQYNLTSLSTSEFVFTFKDYLQKEKIVY